VLRVTPDTNILVSGLVFRRGKPHQLLRMALDGVVSMIVSQAIIDETTGVLARKFGASIDDIAEAKAIIADAARTITPTVQLDVVKEDPPDNRILECAVTAGADYIITGDKDLLRLRRYDSINIITVSEFLELLQKTGMDQ
jgi:uncharacterized protein